jgi:energy-coupling factor transport system substrate-specific component
LATAGKGTPRAGAGGTSSAVRYLQRGVARESGAGDLERALLAGAAAGAADLFTAQRRELVDLIRRDGSVSGQTNLTAFAILALRAAGTRVPARTVRWLAGQQDRDGGFNFLTAPGASDVDDTGAALSALAGAGRPDGGGQRPAGVGRHVLLRAVAYIRSAQNADGGFGQEPGSPSNAQSTAFAVCGLIAAGVDPSALHRHRARSPLAYLRSLVQPSGAVDYSRGNAQTPVWVTAQVAVALAGRSL